MAGLGFNTVGFTPLSVGEQKINEFSVVVNFSNKFDSNYIPLNTVLNNINFSTEFDSNYVFELYTPLIVNFSTEFYIDSKGGIVGMLLFRGRTISK